VAWLSGVVARRSRVACSSTALSASPARTRSAVVSPSVTITTSSAASSTSWPGLGRGWVSCPWSEKARIGSPLSAGAAMLPAPMPSRVPAVRRVHICSSAV